MDDYIGRHFMKDGMIWTVLRKAGDGYKYIAETSRPGGSHRTIIVSSTEICTNPIPNITIELEE